jgi:transposase
MAAKRNLEKYSIRCNKISTSVWQATSTKDISGLVYHCSQKRGNLRGYDGFKRISGTKIHIAVEQNGLPVSIVLSCANEHDSARFLDVMQNMSEYLDDDSIEQIVSVYADKGYDAHTIREYLANRNIRDCIPYRNFKTRHNKTSQNRYNKTRYVVERFFAWLKCGFHRMTIRYERIAENYLGFLNIAGIMMYWRVLG